MSLATGRYQLASAMKTLTVRWDQTCLSWRDAVRHCHFGGFDILEQTPHGRG